MDTAITGDFRLPNFFGTNDFVGKYTLVFLRNHIQKKINILAKEESARSVLFLYLSLRLCFVCLGRFIFLTNIFSLNCPIQKKKNKFLK